MTVRIISGERRGARLRTPEGDATRPLRDRVREALFNIIRESLFEARVLDGFAGSGAVGLEALSNGASSATFVECDGNAVAAINDNIRKLRYEDRARLVRGAIPGVLGREETTFTVVFLMPPYQSGLCQAVMTAGAFKRVLAPDALVVCEVHRDEPWNLADGYTLLQDRLYGITRLLIATW